MAARQGPGGMGGALRGALSAAAAVGRAPGFREPRLAAGRTFWLEQRPQERGRTTLLVRETHPQGGDAGAAIELTPGLCNLRSRVHDYGGGVYAVEGTTVVFVEDRDRCLWRLDLPAGLLPDAIGPPQRLTAPDEAGSSRAFADGLIDPGRRRWLGVMEQRGCDQLVAVSLEGGGAAGDGEKERDDTRSPPRSRNVTDQPTSAKR